MARLVKLCFTAEYTHYFKDIQRYGSFELIKRFDDIENIIKRKIDPKFQHFLSQPIVSEDSVEWYTIPYTQNPIRLNELKEDDRIKYLTIKNETLSHFSEIVHVLQLEGRNNEADCLASAIRFVNDDFIYCFDDKTVLGIWGMNLRHDVRNPIGIAVKDDYKEKKVKVVFNAGVEGDSDGVTSLYKKKNETISDEEIPVITAKEGFKFIGWEPNPENFKVTGYQVFNARYEINEPASSEIVPPVVIPQQEPKYYRVNFIQGEGGSLKGTSELIKNDGDVLHTDEVPEVEPIDGYEFVGWDKEPNGFFVNEDTQFTAQYRKINSIDETKIPWWKRLWLWFIGKGCLNWLLRFLLFLLLLLLLLWLLNNCRGCSTDSSAGSALGYNDSTWLKEDPNVGDGGGIYDPHNPYEPKPTPPGYEEILPPEEGVLPPIDDDPEIIPGNPTIIGNRLNLLMENTDKSILEFAKAFKSIYLDDKYKVVYYDDVVKRMQIEIPSDERESLKQEIPGKFASEYELFVFDEALFEGTYLPNDPAVADAEKGWYLNAIKAPQAWDISKGSEKITVAIVDNGFNLKHPELKSKVVKPYNVWKHSSEIFAQEVDHGTHVAGTALAIANNGKGISGIAPECRFMPVQVADKRGLMTTTSILDGILFALYQGADVINVSLGTQFEGLDQYPEDVQQELIHSRFKEEERLWREIMRIAANHNSTIVLAAGNDNVLAGIDAMQRPELFITVSAVDKDNRNFVKANFSNYGEYSTISAPGVKIFSSVGSNDYQLMDGTSMAAPIITGAVALMKSINDTITTKRIICILKATGLDTQGNIGKLVQLDKALNYVKTGHVVDCTPVPSTGDVQILLGWNNYNDLDLICNDPQNNSIWYKNREVPSGGQLEIDMNAEYPDSEAPIENIFWQPGSAPEGTYNVYLKYFKQHTDINETAFNVTVKYDGQIKTFEGSIKDENTVIHLCSFTIGNGGSSSNSPVNENPSSPPPSSNLQRDKLEKERTRLQRELERVNEELLRIGKRR